MKKILFSILILFNLSSNAQKIVINIDRGQNFDHDSSISTTDAIISNKINYTTAGSTELTYIFDFNKMIMVRKYKNGNEITKKMYKNFDSKNLIDVFVDFEDGMRNYTVFNFENKNLFVSRTYEGTKITGWFDDNIEIKKRP